MKLIIAGSRTFDNMLTIEDIDIAIKKFKLKPTLILCGKCNGPDEMGNVWGEARGVERKYFDPKWDDVENCKTVKINKWGKPYNYMAGFQRNQEMADEADALLVFWDGESSGSKDMIDRASKKGIPIYEAKPNPEYIVE